MSDPRSWYSIAFALLHLIVGIPCNVLIIVVFVRKKPRTSTGVLIIGQAAVDLVAAFFAPVIIAQAAATISRDSWPCMLTRYAYCFLGYSLFCFAVVFAFDRYVVVCKPYGDRSSKQRAAVGTLTVIAVSLLFAIPRIFYNDARNLSCIDSHLNGNTVDTWVKTAVFILTLVNVSILYGVIYKTQRKHARTRARLGKRTHGEGGERDKSHKKTFKKNSGHCSQNILLVEIEPASPQKQMDFVKSKTGGELDASPDKLCVSPVIVSRHTRSSLNHDDADEDQDDISSFTHVTTVPGPSAGETSRMERRRSRFSEPNTVMPAGSEVEKRRRQTRRSLSVSAMTRKSRPINLKTASATTRREKTVTIDSCSLQQRDQLRFRREQSRDNLITAMLLVTTICVFSSCMPSIILNHMEDALKHHITLSLVIDNVVFFLNYLPTLNHIIKCFIYAAMNCQFRRDCRIVLSKYLCCRREQIQIEI